ncbi:MAG: hypothetical protein R2706_04400 [Acidimicrobiales bacterium]
MSTIVSVETFVVANPPPRHGGRYFLFVKLTTDDGVTGLGRHTWRPSHPISSPR